MAPAFPETSGAFVALGEALLIGFLVGAQRESAVVEQIPHPGVRDFILIGLAGGICGLLQNSVLTAAALISIAGLLGLFHLQSPERKGITTEMAAVATFCLGFLTATPGYALGAPLAIAATIAVVVFLEAKPFLHKLVGESHTEAELNATLRFLAVVFVIYPILPQGKFGLYGFFEPRKVWLFVILVSSISYVGYFLTKFLGEEKGLRLTSVLGGLSSTTAATISFAHSVQEAPKEENICWQAAVTANAIQAPRVMAILIFVSPAMAAATAIPLAFMCAAGLAAGWLIGRFTVHRGVSDGEVPLSNPFRLWPALKFGLLFTGILFVTKMAAARFGGGGAILASGIAGTIDADSVSVSLADILGAGKIPLGTAATGVYLAIIANAVVKSIFAGWIGKWRFGLKVAAGFAVMFAAGALALLIPSLG
jgi:uncharacterized membrane protein (DUF4010 family)